MARKSKTGVLKRLREVKKAEKAALKRDQKEIRRQNVGEAERVATKDDLEGYGFATDADEEEAADAPPAGSRCSPVLLAPLLPFEVTAKRVECPRFSRHE